MQFKSDMEGVWNTHKAKNQDFYGSGIFAFAERWAARMEEELAAGKPLVEIALPTSHERKVDSDGITGFMYGAAVAELSECWKWGDELRRWHNARYGDDSDTPGVINPAIITLPD